jgi:ceramide glucosyltransferase
MTLIQSEPHAGLKLVANPALHGPNRKISNLVNMQEAARGEVIVLADSDMRVSPDYLSLVVGALHRPGIGLVTCLYRGLPANGVWSSLSAMAIDHHFLPGVLVGLRLGMANPCFGSTIALRRDTLARIGDFKAFAAYLADDYAIGAAVRGLGYQVALPAMVIEHVCSEANLSELFAHELRWAGTIRRVDPVGFAGSAVTHPVPFALLGLLLAPGLMGMGLLAASLACRLALQIQVDRVLGVRPGRFLWGPARDLLSFAVFLASYWTGAVSWRGRRYHVGRDGRLT